LEKLSQFSPSFGFSIQKTKKPQETLQGFNDTAEAFIMLNQFFLVFGMPLM